MPEEVKAEEVLAGGPALDRVIETLAHDGLIAYPTETFYGLGANALSGAAVERIFAAKGRPEGLPIPVIVAGAGALEALAPDVPPGARRLMAAFWPGPLTLVLRAAATLPDRLTAGGGKVGVRVSSHPVAAAIAGRCRFPITATSANRSGETPAASAAALDPAILASLDLVIDGGGTPGGPASTVLDTTVDPPRVLRAGAVSEDEIEAALKDPARETE